MTKFQCGGLSGFQNRRGLDGYGNPFGNAAGGDGDVALAGADQLDVVTAFAGSIIQGCQGRVRALEGKVAVQRIGINRIRYRHDIL